MATQVVMPKLSPTMEEGQLSRWLKKEGDKVSVGEPLAEVDTDKATMEAQALADGVLLKVLVKEGETVPLGQVIAIIGEPGEDISGLVSEASSGAAQAGNEERVEESVKGEPVRGDVGGQPEAPPAAASEAKPAQTQQAQAQSQPQTQAQPQPAADAGGNGRRGDSGRLIVSPIAARMAAEAGINLQTLSGTGPGGRIVKRDIEAAMKGGQQQRAAAQPQAAPAQADAEAAPQQQVQAQPSGFVAASQPASIEGPAPFHDEPMTPMRATIARRLAASLGPVPHIFLTTEIEMDRAAELRRQINELDPEMKISINDLIIKVAAHALMQHPQVNASFHEKAVRYYERADIGVAVALENGLITPVVRGANAKSVGQIGREVRDLAERARARKLKPEEYTGATFSVSNLGMYGIDEFTALINPPEGAILAVGAMTPKPVVRDGEIVVRQMMRVTASFDHRVIDGATGAKFLQTLKKILENPLYLLA